MTTPFILPEFKIKILLDTNILIYLVENSFENLNTAIDFLGNCPFVDLHTSEYVLIEFINKRKQERYLKILVNENKINLMTAFNYHKEFNAQEIDFEDIKMRIKNEVEQDIEKLPAKNIDLEQHKLHHKLFNTAKKICLLSKLTIYDGLVTASSLEPYCDIILTNDSNFERFFNQNNTHLDNFLNDITKPKVISTKVFGGINLVSNETQHIKKADEIKQHTKNVILENLKSKPNYYGEIFTEQCSSKQSDIICFTLLPSKVLEKSMYLSIIDKNLTNCYSSQKITGFRLEDNSIISEFPFSSDLETKISFKWESAEDNLGIIKQNKNLLFKNPDQ